MKCISSRMTFWYKRVFPVLWFGILAVILATGLLTSNTPPPPFFIMPAVMAVFGYFLMRKLVFDLVDEVWDAGDALVVRNKGQEERIAFADIINVSYSGFSNPPRATLLLRRPSAFGEKITFCAPARWVPFASSPVIDDLIRRVDAARQRTR
jgi:hypothetical protein